MNIFRELVKPRESVFRFGGIGTALAENPAKKLDELFAHYVERQFVGTVEYQETRMTRRLTRVFKAEKILDRYREKRLGNDLYHVTIPFVHEVENRLERAIKPLDLDKQDSTKIFEHGDKWLRRIERLSDMNCLPEHMLFVVRQPQKGKGVQAAMKIREELEGRQVDALLETERGDVLRFARAG